MIKKHQSTSNPITMVLFELSAFTKCTFVEFSSVEKNIMYHSTNWFSRRSSTIGNETFYRKDLHEYETN